MNASAAASELEFDPPGPGTWMQDPVHFPRPISPYWAEMHPEPFKRGFAEFCRFYGILIAGRQMAYPHGFAYGAVVPLPESEVPERFQRADAVWAGKLWREQLRDWEETFKPQAIGKHRELQAVDVDALSDEELVAYLKRCREHHAEMIYQHMRFTGAPSIPTGDFLVHVGQWTGIPTAQLLGLLRGSAPISAGASEQLSRLRAAIAADAAASDLLASEGEPGEILQQLAGLEGETGAAAKDYLDLVGYRLLDGFDISGRYALEMPDQLLRAIRLALEGDGPQATGLDEQVTAVRAQVPEEHRAEFDELLEEARSTYHVRDERGVYSDIWASGIMRRAALGAGRRLAERGRIHDPEHIIDAGFDEMCALITGADGPSADDLAGRQALRLSMTARDVPQVLGDPPQPPPDPSGLPPGIRRVMQSIGLVLDEMFGSSTEEHEEHLLRGLAAGPGVYEGTARRIAGPTEFNRIVQGDVLVTESTTEAFNILLPLLGGIVTDAGGLLSHAAIVAREYGIPGVVGTREGTTLIPDGARVRVDGNAGEVAVLG